MGLRSWWAVPSHPTGASERDRRLAYLGRSRSVDRDGGRMGFQESKTGEDSIGCHTRGTGLEFDFKQSEFPLQSPVVRGPSD